MCFSEIVEIVRRGKIERKRELMDCIPPALRESMGTVTEVTHKISRPRTLHYSNESRHDYEHPPKPDGKAGSLLPGLPEHLALDCLARVPLKFVQGVSSAWQKLTHDSYFHKLRLHHGNADLNWVYILVQTAEGAFKWHAFDPLACKWHDLPPVPHPMEFQLSNPGCIGVSYFVQCASTQSKLVMVAGLRVKKDHDQPRMMLEPALEQLLIFDALHCQWKTGSPFRVPRKWCVCGVADEKLYVASGSGTAWDVDLSKSAEVYDLEADVWQGLSSLSSSKFSGEAMNAVTVGGKLYMVSGRGVFSKVGVMYNPATGLWTDMPPGLRKGWMQGRCVALNGKFFGLDESAGRLKIYDAEEDQWKLFLEDPRLRNVDNVVSMKLGRKLCGVVIGASGNGRSSTNSGSVLRIVDVVSQPPHISDLHVPYGKVVSVQVLTRMSVV